MFENWTRCVFLGGVFATLSACAMAVYPATTISDQVAPDVHGRWVMPSEPGPHPGVLLLHGASGFVDATDPEAQFLADQGFAVLVLDYYRGGADLIDGNAGVSPRTLREQWLANIDAGARVLRSHTSVSNDLIGVVGFSRGAQFGLEYANRTSAVGAVVAYYGLLYDYADDRRPSTASVQDLPPTLILHGDADQIVDVSYGEEMRDLMESAGRTVEFVSYPGMGHAWWIVGPQNAASEAAWQDSLERTADFLTRQLDQRSVNAN